MAGESPQLGAAARQTCLGDHVRNVESASNWEEKERKKIDESRCQIGPKLLRNTTGRAASVMGRNAVSAALIDLQGWTRGIFALAQQFEIPVLCAREYFFQVFRSSVLL